MSTDPQTPDQPQERTDAAQEAQEPQEAPETPEGTQEAQEDDQGNPNAEAKRYRLKLRETEANLEAAQQRVANLQRTLAEAALEDHLAKPGDLWDIGGQEVSSFYDDDGDLDRDRLTEAAQQLTSDRPGLGAQQRIVIPNVGDVPGRMKPADPFTEAFKPPNLRQA